MRVDGLTPVMEKQHTFKFTLFFQNSRSLQATSQNNLVFEIRGPSVFKPVLGASSRLMKKLDLHSLADLVRFAVRNRIIRA